MPKRINDKEKRNLVIMVAVYRKLPQIIRFYRTEEAKIYVENVVKRNARIAARRYFYNDSKISC